MGIELPRDVARVGDQRIVVAEQAADHLTNLGFADAHLAAKYQRRVQLLLWMLEDVGEPPDDPVVEGGIVAADVVAKVGEKLGAVSRSRLDGEPLPHVVVARAAAARRELYALKLTPPRVSQPMVSDRDCIIADHYPLVGIPLFEGSDLQQAKLSLALHLHHCRLVAGKHERMVLVNFVYHGIGRVSAFGHPLPGPYHLALDIGIPAILPAVLINAAAVVGTTQAGIDDRAVADPGPHCASNEYEQQLAAARICAAAHDAEQALQYRRQVGRACCTFIGGFALIAV